MHTDNVPWPDFIRSIPVVAVAVALAGLGTGADEVREWAVIVCAMLAAAVTPAARSESGVPLTVRGEAVRWLLQGLAVGARVLLSGYGDPNRILLFGGWLLVVEFAAGAWAPGTVGRRRVLVLINLLVAAALWVSVPDVNGARIRFVELEVPTVLGLYDPADQEFRVVERNQDFVGESAGPVAVPLHAPYAGARAGHARLLLKPMWPTVIRIEAVELVNYIGFDGRVVGRLRGADLMHLVAEPDDPAVQLAGNLLSVRVDGPARWLDVPLHPAHLDDDVHSLLGSHSLRALLFWEAGFLVLVLLAPRPRPAAAPGAGAPTRALDVLARLDQRRARGAGRGAQLVPVRRDPHPRAVQPNRTAEPRLRKQLRRVVVGRVLPHCRARLLSPRGRRRRRPAARGLAHHRAVDVRAVDGRDRLPARTGRHVRRLAGAGPVRPRRRRAVRLRHRPHAGEARDARQRRAGAGERCVVRQRGDPRTARGHQVLRASHRRPAAAHRRGDDRTRRRVAHAAVGGHPARPRARRAAPFGVHCSRPGRPKSAEPGHVLRPDDPPDGCRARRAAPVVAPLGRPDLLVPGVRLPACRGAGRPRGRAPPRGAGRSSPPGRWSSCFCPWDRCTTTACSSRPGSASRRRTSPATGGRGSPPP
ncbi:MAG: hypothetical protein M5U09_28880 [Gammaproteobacteria bacterium]|nr:hypothetical protein [Gammaproteobacteria bacterium]